MEGASYTMLAFIHFSMIQGITTNKLLMIQDRQLQTILPAFKLEKQIVAKKEWRGELTKYPELMVEIIDIIAQS